MVCKFSNRVSSVPTEPAPPRQLGLDLGTATVFDRANFYVSDANAPALALLEAWPHWPDFALLLCGPTGSGKSHLARIWADIANADIIEARDLAHTSVAAVASHGALVVENAEMIGAGEPELFHLLNLMRERKGWLLLTAATMPDHWHLATPDLLSRLRLAPSLAIQSPNDELVRRVLLKNFADRQLVVDAGVVDYIVMRMERSFAAARILAQRLDAEALSRGTPVNRAIVAAVLAEIYGRDDLFDAS